MGFKEKQYEFLLKIWELSGERTYEWVRLPEIMESLSLSENETDSLFSRMYEQGWVDGTLGATVCVKPYGQEVLDEYMEKSYAEEELLVLKTIYEMGQNLPSGYIDFNKVQATLPDLKTPFHIIIHELEKNKHYLGDRIDEMIRISPTGLEFLQNRANRNTGVSVNYNQTITTGDGSPVTIGDGNTVFTHISVNPEFNSAISAITDLVKASSMPADDIREALEDLAAINRLALQEKSEGIIARGIAKIGSLETLIKAAGLISQISPYIPHLLSAFRSQ